jgi:hypothetical protein
MVDWFIPQQIKDPIMLYMTNSNKGYVYNTSVKVQKNFINGLFAV